MVLKKLQLAFERIWPHSGVLALPEHAAEIVKHAARYITGNAELQQVPPYLELTLLKHLDDEVRHQFMKTIRFYRRLFRDFEAARPRR